MPLSVAVASGVVQVNGASVDVAADTLGLSDADATDPRFDLVVSDDAGVLSIVEGTPDPNPGFPTIPADSVVLAAVYIPANITEVANSNIIDKRVFVAALAVPHGSIMAWGGQIADLPNGWLLCNGDSLLRADYPLLFAAIGTMHGSADGTHFNLPDLRDKFIVGATSDDSAVAKSNIQGSLLQTGGVTGHLHSAHTSLTHTGGAVTDHPTLAHTGVAVADHASIAALSHTNGAVANHPSLAALAHAGAAVATHASVAALAHANSAVADHASIAALTHANGAVADHASWALAALSHTGMAVGDHGSISKSFGTSAGTVVSVATHALTQPTTHATSVLSQPAAAHTLTQPDTHVSRAALAHTVTQPDNHPSIAALSHTLTQPNDHPSIAAVAHTLTQPDAHASMAALTHVITQPASHGVVTHAFTQPDVHTISAHNTTTNVPTYYALAWMIAA